jgi:hypothetical protein
MQALTRESADALQSQANAFDVALQGHLQAAAVTVQSSDATWHAKMEEAHAATMLAQNDLETERATWAGEARRWAAVVKCETDASAVLTAQLADFQRALAQQTALTQAGFAREADLVREARDREAALAREAHDQKAALEAQLAAVTGERDAARSGAAAVADAGSAWQARAQEVAQIAADTDAHMVARETAWAEAWAAEVRVVSSAQFLAGQHSVWPDVLALRRTLADCLVKTRRLRDQKTMLLTSLSLAQLQRRDVTAQLHRLAHAVLPAGSVTDGVSIGEIDESERLLEAQVVSMENELDPTTPSYRAAVAALLEIPIPVLDALDAGDSVNSFLLNGPAAASHGILSTPPPALALAVPQPVLAGTVEKMVHADDDSSKLTSFTFAPPYPPSAVKRSSVSSAGMQALPRSQSEPIRKLTRSRSVTPLGGRRIVVRSPVPTTIDPKFVTPVGLTPEGLSHPAVSVQASMSSPSVALCQPSDDLAPDDIVWFYDDAQDTLVPLTWQQARTRGLELQPPEVGAMFAEHAAGTFGTDPHSLPLTSPRMSITHTEGPIYIAYDEDGHPVELTAEEAKVAGLWTDAIEEGFPNQLSQSQAHVEQLNLTSPQYHDARRLSDSKQLPRASSILQPSLQLPRSVSSHSKGSISLSASVLPASFSSPAPSTAAAAMDTHQRALYARLAQLNSSGHQVNSYCVSASVRHAMS